MQHRSSIFPGGQTTASKVKALFAYLQAEKGPEVATRWLERVQMTANELEDETRLVSIATLHRALKVFTEVASREEIPATWRHLVAPDNIGAWMRALRGSAKPEEAFERIDGNDTGYGRTTRWETIEARDGAWRGRIHLAHDPSLEEDGLLNLARKAELTAIPALFGYGPGTVTTEASREKDKAKRESWDKASSEFQVTWAVPTASRSGAIGAVVGGIVGGASFAVHDFAFAPLVALVAAALGAGVGVNVTREKRKRAETFAQTTRVNALERSLALKDGRDREAAGNLEGTVVAGQFRIRARMGSGASGVIYEASRLSDGVPVAIKLLRAAAAHDATASDRLRREAEALGLAWHPNVVEVIDYGHLGDGTAYMVMELLKGESLAARIKARVRLTPAELHPIATQVIEALVAVHAAGVVHRDIKPSNVFLTPTVDADGIADGGEHVKVLDFGIARVEWEETRITNMGAPMGTPGYMSPEQESGGVVDARSDIFAFGALLYECLVGEPPPSATETAPPLWRSSIAPPGEAQASGVQSVAVPPAWKAVIEKAMARAPEARFADARSFAQALRGLRELSMRPEARHPDR